MMERTVASLTTPASFPIRMANQSGRFAQTNKTLWR
jgi:hypothetical protein